MIASYLKKKPAHNSPGVICAPFSSFSRTRPEICTNKPARKTRAGFTLVELLVVIAIISVLASMLLPALRQAMSSSRSISCQNRLKQLGMWGITYADDWDGVLPTSYWSVYTGPQPSYTGWQDKHPCDNGEGLNRDSLRCPALAPMIISGWHKNNSHFGIANGLAIMGQISGGGIPKTRLLTSKCYWWSDGHARPDGPDSSTMWYTNPNLKYQRAAAAYGGIHEGPWTWQEAFVGSGHPKNGGCGSNIVFGDGHVEQYERIQVLEMTNQEYDRFKAVP